MSSCALRTSLGEAHWLDRCLLFGDICGLFVDVAYQFVKLLAFVCNPGDRIS